MAVLDDPSRRLSTIGYVSSAKCKKAARLPQEGVGRMEGIPVLLTVVHARPLARLGFSSYLAHPHELSWCDPSPPTSWIGFASGEIQGRRDIIP